MKLYHVTHTDRIPSILEKGLLPFQSSNWVRMGSGERYGNGEIFACTDERDALKWAAKMEWDFYSQMGGGKVSIVEFVSAHKWEDDDADQLSQLGLHGKWVKRHGAIPAKNIVGHKVLTIEMVRTIVHAA